MTLKEMREARATLVAELRGMITAAETENRDFTAEEAAAYDAKNIELTKLDDRIGRILGVEAHEAAGQVVIPAAARRVVVAHAPGPEASREFENLGEFMAAVRFRPNDQRLNFVEGVGAGEDLSEIGAEFRMDNAAGGGFMIPPQFRATIMSVPPEAALVRPRANVIEAGDPPDAGITMPALNQTGANPGNMYGGMSFKWIGEGDTKPETGATLREITLTPHEIAGTVTVTDKLLRNWRAASTFIEGLMRQGVVGAEDYAFLRGDGVAKPLGAINSGAAYYVNRATANTVTYLDLVAMVGHLLMRGGVSPVWSMPQSAIIPLATLTDPGGRYIWQPNARDGFAGDLLGYPVRWNNRSSALGAKGDIFLADWSYYLIKDGSGPFVAASEHVLFLQNKTVIKIFWNVDGAPWLTAPIVEENGYQVSPFVGLDVPAA